MLMESSRRIAVIMFTDIVSYTSMMSRDENAAMKILEQNRRLHHQYVSQYAGQLLKEMGDGLLISFPSSSDALRCGGLLCSQAKASGYELRIGIHLGEVLFQDNDVFGDGVNIASRVEGMAVPGSVLFTEKIYDDVRNKPELPTTFLGTFQLKNVEKSTRIYALALPGLSVPKLEKEQSYSKSVGLLRGKRKVSIITGVVMLIAVFGVLFWPKESDQNRDAGIEDSTISIAAIPFSNISGESESDFLGFALVDQVISSLSYLRNIVVRPSSSIRKYEDQVVDPEIVSRELDVRYLLMGHYVKNQDSIRLNLELIDSRQNQVLWRESIEEQMEDAFRMQNKVANRVIEGLRVQLSSEEQSRMEKDTPDDPLAYEYYLKSLSYPQNVEGNRLARSMLTKSIELDSTFAPAYDELGNRIYQLARYTIEENSGEVIQQAIDAHHAALRLNPEHLGALRNLSFIQTEVDQKDQALELARRMVQINPNNSQGHFALCYVCRYTGMIDEAIESMERGMRIASRDRQFRSAGVTYNLAGRYSNALASLQFDDGSGFAEGWKGVTYIRLGDTAKAILELEMAAKKDPGGIFELWSASMTAGLKGSHNGWIEKIREVEEDIQDPESIYSWSMNNIVLGDFDFALALIDKAVDKGYYPYTFFLIDPILDPIREDSRFKRILEKAKIKHEAFKQRHFPD